MFRVLISLIFLPLSLWAHPVSELEQAYTDKGANYVPRTQHIDNKGRAKFVNHLILESSPYLLQHAHNPVNWYSFSDEAFDKAKLENKLIFISIGYATCHWCHVMEEESFDDKQVAEFINKHFVAIKVDREIRPDVDTTYMNASQLINGSGGWPLNVIILPDGKAFFAGVYFTKSQLLEILLEIQRLWKTDREKVINQANEIDKTLNKTKIPTLDKIDQAIASKAIRAILSNFDDFEGGFDQAPKFPNETILLLLIDEQKRQPTDKTLDAITTTLNIMASGGFYDLVGGGFHRYSTDNAWLIPHFEKMLYNQAQLSLVYTRAYQLTQKALYKRVSKQTLDYVLREMKNINGGFFSATDADSQGEEGVFFVWSKSDLKNSLNQNEFEYFNQYFDLSPYTDFEGNHVIRYKDIDNLNEDDYTKIDKLLAKLYRPRAKRERPLTDTKILLSWNALMIPSLLEAGMVFNEDKYTQAGLTLADYLTTFSQNNKLYRVSINNQLQADALLEDYAYLANAYLSVFDHSNNQIWLDRTIQLLKQAREKFWDEEQLGFNIGADNKYLNNRYKESYDGAIPSANATMYNVLVKLNNRVSNKDYVQQTKQLLDAFSTQINQDPYSHSSFILGVNNAKNGELSNIQYAYDGRIRIQSQKLENNQVVININLDPLWHINSNQPLQDSLITTKVTNLDTKHWAIKNSSYPKGEMAKLGFSKDEISIYKDKVGITVDLSRQSENYITPSLLLSLQACSDKVCLPPTSVTLKP